MTPIEADAVPPGLNEEIIRRISARKREPQFLPQRRLKAYRHWLTMNEPTWANVKYPPIDYQSIVHYSVPKGWKDRPHSLDEVDPELIPTYEKLGIPLCEQERLAGVAAHRALVVNGRPSGAPPQLAGLEWLTLEERLRQRRGPVHEHRAWLAAFDRHAMLALNTVSGGRRIPTLRPRDPGASQGGAAYGAPERATFGAPQAALGRDR